MVVDLERIPESNESGSDLVSEKEVATRGLADFIQFRKKSHDDDVFTPLDQDTDTEISRGKSEELFDEPTDAELEEIQEIEQAEDFEDGVLFTDSVEQYLRTNGNHHILTAAQEVQNAKLIELGVEAEKQLLEIKESGDDSRSISGLSELKRQIDNGKRAKQTMIECNVKLVVSVVKKFNGHGVPMADLIQEGNLGLIRAVEKFDWRRGYKFSTYATWWIRQAAQRSIPNTARTIRLPVHIHDQLLSISKAKRSIWEQSGHEADVVEIAELTGLSINQINEAVEKNKIQPASLNQQVGFEGETELGELLDPGQNREVVATEDDIETIAEKLRYENVLDAISGLPEAHQKVLLLKYGLDESGNSRTHEEIGREMGFSRARAAQIESEALKRLRNIPGLEDKVSDAENFERQADREARDDGRANEVKQELIKRGMPEANIDKLTTVQSIIAYLIHKGQERAEIAKELGINERTVKDHITNLKTKLKIKDDRNSKKLLKKLSKIYDTEPETV